MALAAYAGAGIAGSDPFKTGFTAFRLAYAKALVPFVFTYAPVLLLILDFNWFDFIVVFAGAVIGITALGAAVQGYLLAPIDTWERLALFVAAFLLIAPGLKSSLVGGGILAVISILQYLHGRKGRLAQEAES